MTKDVLVSISSVQISAYDEKSEIKTAAKGSYYYKNNSHYVVYDEAVEGMEQIAKNMLRITSTSLEITKKGSVNSKMVFEKGQKSHSTYSTPYGDIRLGITTGKVELTESGEQLSVEVEYGLEMNDEFLTNCKIHIEVNSCSNIK